MSCPDDSKFCECIHTLNVNVNDLVELVIVDGGVMLGKNGMKIEP